MVVAPYPTAAQLPAGYSTDFCYDGDYKTTSTFVECYGDSVTLLHIMGPSAGVPPLPKTSSIDASGTTRCRVRCRSPSGTWGCCGRWCSCATTSPDLSAARTEGGQRRDERALGAGHGHRARLGVRRQQGQGRARGQRRRSARRRGRLPRHAEGGREARQGQAAPAAGAWWSTRTHRSSSLTRATSCQRLGVGFFCL